MSELDYQMHDERASARDFWRRIIRAFEVKLLEVEAIQGASGLHHSVITAGVDHARRRLIIISAEADARSAALVQGDIQSAFRDVQVIMVRALRAAGEREQCDHTFEQTGGTNLEKLSETRATLTEQDRQLGLCAASADDFSEEELALLLDGNDAHKIRAMLSTHHLQQYFFPAPDHLALGLIERWRFTSIPQLVDRLVRAPDLGHPFGPTELMPAQYSFTEMIQELAGLGLIGVEREGLLITEEGRRLRAGVRDKPREGLVSKILNRLTASLNFKSLWIPILRRGQEDE